MIKKLENKESLSHAPSTTDFDSSTYVKVNDRISQFYSAYPDGIIHTMRSKEQGGVVFQSVILRDQADIEQYATLGIAKANGFSYLPDEARKQLKVEEYAETVSVGRALAKFGIEIEKSIASKEEMDQFKRIHVESTDLEASPSDTEDENLEEKELPKLKTSRSLKTRGSTLLSKVKEEN